MQTIQELVARKLQTEVLSDQGRTAWFWLKGGNFGESGKSYLGLSNSLLSCDAKTETRFRKQLSENWLQEFEGDTKHDLQESSEFKNSFNGGWLLALAYEFGASITATNSDQTTGLALHVPAVIEVDHTNMTSLVVQSEEGDGAKAISERLSHILAEATKDQLDHSAEKLQDSTKEIIRRPENPLIEPKNMRMPKSQYVSAIESAKTSITNGEASVLCLTNQFEIPTQERVDPLPIFLAMQESSDAPRAGIIEWRNARSLTTEWIVSASPERLLVKRDANIRSAPIKGTRKRGSTLDEDLRLKDELLQSDKELIENARVLAEVKTELEAICEPGSVAITSNGHIESYAQVHQLVSEVEGVAISRNDLWAAIDALFVPASMTGVPKAKAIDVVKKLEGASRGWYSGCFGTVSPGAVNADLAVTIRSLECDSKTIRIGAGGGITELSDAEFEWQEVLHKSRAMLNALQNEA